MSNIKLENLDSQNLPFFTRFLEGQSSEDLSEEEMQSIHGGCGGFFTKKYPSDQEESGVTKKAPSDTDELVTDKYPSDSDEDAYLIY